LTNDRAHFFTKEYYNYGIQEKIIPLPKFHACSTEISQTKFDSLFKLISRWQAYSTLNITLEGLHNQTTWKYKKNAWTFLDKALHLANIFTYLHQTYLSVFHTYVQAVDISSLNLSTFYISTKYNFPVNNFEILLSHTDIHLSMLACL
jgi:hypothetical protein